MTPEDGLQPSLNGHGEVQRSGTTEPRTNDMTEEAKHRAGPCPFDDGSGKHRVRVERRKGLTLDSADTPSSWSPWFRERVICECGASGPEFKRPDCAIPAWNRRAALSNSEPAK